MRLNRTNPSHSALSSCLFFSWQTWRTPGADRCCEGSVQVGRAVVLSQTSTLSEEISRRDVTSLPVGSNWFTLAKLQRQLSSSSFRLSTPKTHLPLCSLPSICTLEQSGHMSCKGRTLRSSAPHHVNLAVCSGWRHACNTTLGHCALLPSVLLLCLHRQRQPNTEWERRALVMHSSVQTRGVKPRFNKELDKTWQLEIQKTEWDWTKCTSMQGATASLRWGLVSAFTAVVATDTETAGAVTL